MYQWGNRANICKDKILLEGHGITLRMKTEVEKPGTRIALWLQRVDTKDVAREDQNIFFDYISKAETNGGRIVL